MTIRREQECSRFCFLSLFKKAFFPCHERKKRGFFDCLGKLSVVFYENFKKIHKISKFPFIFLLEYDII